MADHPLTVEFSKEVDYAIRSILPHEKIFSIQVGNRLFRMSGLSLSSDAPSYFTRFFKEEENEGKVLFIDRNPEVFEHIYHHLQGYPINVKCDYSFVHLWSDSFYFGLRNLQHFLINEHIFANIGNQTFKIAKSLFVNTGNYPNYFTVLYDSLLSDNIDVIESKGMLRPPPLRPPVVPSRSPVLFGDLLDLLRGNHAIIRDDEHRALLVRECKYYRFLELEQRILKHKIINNPFSPHQQEIIIGLTDLHKKGFVNVSPADKSKEVPLMYKRPFLLREPTRSLIFSLDTLAEKHQPEFSEVKLILNKTVGVAIVTITHKLAEKFRQFVSENDTDLDFEKVNGVTTVRLPAGFSGCRSYINGREMKDSWVHDIMGVDLGTSDSPVPKRRKTDEVVGDLMEFKLTKSLWRIAMRGNLVRLHGVSIEGFSDQKEYLRKQVEFI